MNMGAFLLQKEGDIMGKKLAEMTLEELWQLFPIALTAPNPKWAEQYRETEERLAALLHDWHPTFHHIGSTAVNGIWAKPIVDVLAAFGTKEELQSAADCLETAGFRVMSREENRISLNEGYTEEGFAEKVYHIHLRLRGDQDEVYFRDYLNAHPETAKEYEALKLRLWKQYEYNRDAYTDAKTSFIQRYTELAKVENDDSRRLL